MSDMFATTVLVVLAILTIFGLAVLIRWVLRLWDVRLRLVDAVIIAFGVVVVVTGIVLALGNTAWPAKLVVFFLIIILIAAAGALGMLVQSMVLPPSVDSAIRRGWIKVRPQLLVRRKANKAFVDYACAITRMNMPMAEGFYLAAHQTPGRTSVVLQGIASFLFHGLKLSEAYARYRARSALVLSMLQIGERCGQLPDALEYMQAHLAREQRLRQQRGPSWWLYPITMLFLLFCVGSFLMVVVVPKFEQIFKDFGTTLPLATQILIGLANDLHHSILLPWALAPAVALLVILQVSPRRYPVPRFYHRLVDYLAWSIPGWRAKHQYASMAHAAAVLRVTLCSGMTMPEAIKAVADLDLNIVLRERFRKLYDLHLGGESIEQAGQKLGLPPRFLWALRSGQDRETLQASLELIERYYSLVASHWYLAMNTMLWPAVIVALGTIVGFVVFAFFLPVVRLIEVTTPW